MTGVIGVDFSGAVADRATWFAQGRLEDGSLILERVQPVRRDDLYELMMGVTVPAVAAMDFPFGLPEELLPEIGMGDDYLTISEIWPVVALMERQDLRDLGATFVRVNGREARRVGDDGYSERFSPLHKVNPDMVPMTLEGARLLSRWWERDDRPPWYVLPVDLPPGPDEGAVTVMETMPGAFLKAVKLPYRLYKGAGQEGLRRRDCIIGNLAAVSGIKLPNLGDFRYACRANHDCLDAVVAAVCAASWRHGALQFRLPGHLGGAAAAARREGWIYVPVGRAVA